LSGPLDIYPQGYIVRERHQRSEEYQCSSRNRRSTS
jgi:hypothetical protein